MSLLKTAEERRALLKSGMLDTNVEECAGVGECSSSSLSKAQPAARMAQIGAPISRAGPQLVLLTVSS